MNPKELWKATLGEIELQISKPNFITWLKSSELVERNEREGVVLVGLPNNFAKEWVRNRYHKLILGSLRNLDSSIRNVDYIVLTGAREVPARVATTKVSLAIIFPAACKRWVFPNPTPP